MLAGAVEIEALLRVDTFNRDAGRKIRPGLRDMTQSMSRAVDGAAKDFDRLGDAASDAFSGIGEELLNDLDVTQEFRGIVQDLERTADRADLDIESTVDLVGEEQLDELRRIVADISNTPIRLDADGKPAADQIERVQAALKGVSDATIVIAADNTRAKAEIDELIDLTGAIERIRPTVDITVQDQAIRSARGLVEDLNRDANVKVKVDDSEVDAVSTRSLEIPATVDDGSLADSLAGALRGAGPVGAAVASAGLVLGGLIAKSVSDGIEREASNDRLAAQLGLTGTDAAEVQRIASDLFAGAYGDSFTEVADTVRDAAALSIPDLERMVGVALSMQAAFDGAAGEYLQLAEQLRQEGVTDSVEESLDFLTASFQQLPGNLAEPLSEAVREYGIFLSQLGFSTEEIFGGLTEAALKGEFQLDKFGDAIKEFGIRATDGSKETVKAFGEIGASTEQMDMLVDSLLAGGPAARDSLFTIVDGLLAVEDQQDRANATIALFGAPLEDLSVQQIPQFLEGLQDLGDGFDDVGGRAGELDAAINDNVQIAVTTFIREWEEALTQFGTVLIDAVQSGDSAALKAESEALGERLGEQIATGVALGIEVLPNIIGPVFDNTIIGVVDGLIPEFEAGGLELGEALGKAVAVGANIPAGTQAAFDTFNTEFREDAKKTASEIAAIVDGELSAGSPSNVSISDLFQIDDGTFEQAAGGIKTVGEAAEDATAAFEDLAERSGTVIDNIRAINRLSSGASFRDIASGGQQLLETVGGADLSIITPTGEFDRSTEAGQAAEAALESYRDVLVGVAEELANGSKGAADFAEAQFLVEQNVRAALTELGVTGPLLEGLVDEFSTLGVVGQRELEAIIAEQNQLFDATSKAATALERLPKQFQLEFDLDRSGLIEADEAAVLFSETNKSAILGFDADLSGQVELIEAARAIEALEFLTSLGFDTDLSGGLEFEEQAAAFGLIEEFATLGFDVDQDGEVSAREFGVKFAVEQWLAGLGYELNDEGLVVAVGRASSEFELRRFITELGANPAQAVEAIGGAEQLGQSWAGRIYQALVDANPGPFNSDMDAAERRRNGFDGSSATVTLRLRDLASARAEAIRRGLSSTVTFNVRAGQRIGAEGMILGSGGVQRLQDGGVLDGIQPAIPGGREGFFGQQPILISENGGDELFINSRSNPRRQADLIRQFDGGSLVDVVRNEILDRTAPQRLQDGGILASAQSTRTRVVGESRMDMSTLIDALDTLTNALGRTGGGGVTNENTFVVDNRRDLEDAYALISQLAG